MLNLTFNTSNPYKQEEIRAFGEELDANVTFTCVDLREIRSTPDEVICHKASQLPLGTIVEDSALFVEGHPETGVDIKFVQDRLPEMVGKRAVFQVRFAGRMANNVYLWKGEVSGTIAPPRGNSKFGFDNSFVPDGQEVPYSMSKPKELNPRYLALRSFVTDQLHPDRVMTPIYDWDGEWQNE